MAFRHPRPHKARPNKLPVVHMAGIGRTDAFLVGLKRSNDYCAEQLDLVIDRWVFSVETDLAYGPKGSIRCKYVGLGHLTRALQGHIKRKSS